MRAGRNCYCIGEGLTTFFFSAMALPSHYYFERAMRRSNLCFSISLKSILNSAGWLEVTRFEGRSKIALPTAGARIAFELVASELGCIIRNGTVRGVVWAVCCFR